jgi:hypothetical protein
MYEYKNVAFVYFINFCQNEVYNVVLPYDQISFHVCLFTNLAEHQSLPK